MLFKVLNAAGESCHGGASKWNLPTQNADGSWTPGEWMPAIEGPLALCKNGYHLCQENDLIGWLHESIYEAEYRGEIVEGGNKVVVREARLLRRMNWDDKVARLFACWCAEQVLPLYEAKYPNDDRPRKAIEAARRYANGEATAGELAAADAAALSAAHAAYAANDAAYAANDAADAAAYAADAAAGAAAYAAYAAAHAAYVEANAAARAAQTKRLLEMIGAK